MNAVLMTIPEAARRLRVSRSHAYELARQRIIPTVRLGERALRVPSQELDRWLARRTVKATDDQDGGGEATTPAAAVGPDPGMAVGR